MRFGPIRLRFLPAPRSGNCFPHRDFRFRAVSVPGSEAEHPPGWHLPFTYVPGPVDPVQGGRMQSLETLMREAGVDQEPRARVEAILADLGSELLESVIDSLPEKQRLVLALRYYESLHVPEIAAVLGSKEATVEELLQKSIHALCRKVERAAAGRASTRMAHAEGAGR